jgi:hypothetical protein
MKITATVARLLLGAIFLVFGSNLYLHFLKMGPMPTGVQGQFFGALFVSHYIYVVAFFQVVPAILLLSNRYVPLALALLGPVIVNILVTHITMAPSGLPLASLVALLWVLVAYPIRRVFYPLLQQRVQG